jgi:RNA polymerase sigma-70 factor (ECF subfamily)
MEPTSKPSKPSDEGGGSTPSSTELLLRRYQRGESGAGDLFFQRVMPSLYRWAHGRFATHLRGANDTRDLVQDAVIKALPKLPHLQYRRRKAVRAYLRTVVQNRFLDLVRRHDVREAGVDRVTAEMTPRSPSPHETLQEREDRERYLAGLQRLSPADRDLIVARVDLGYSYEQIALMTDRTSRDAARMAIARALRKLAAVMDETPDR